MYYDLFYDELIKRYMFLYEYKELILAMCIRKINVDKELNEDIRSWEKYLDRAKITERYLYDDIIASIKNQLGKEKCYLCSSVSSEIVDAFEEVLFSDGNLEDTQIYKHVSGLLNDDMLYESVMSLVSDLEERRNCNLHLKNIPTFTVWKILGYVRRKYNDNSVLLDAIDKYYNIDRTMMSGVDSNCGYLLKGDERFDDDTLSKYASSTIVGGVSGSYIICDYKGNKYELEDDYFKHEVLQEQVSEGEATTVFMEALSKMPMLSMDEKIKIRNCFVVNKKYILE